MEKTLEEKIIEVVKKYPGMTKSIIAWRMDISKWDIIELLYRMVDAGKLRIEYHHDWGNMEHYEKYYLAES